MAYANLDTLIAGQKLDMVQAGSGTSDLAQWATDTLNDPLAAAGAVVADTALSFANFGLSVAETFGMGSGNIHQDVALKMLTDLGFNDTVEYYKKHPDATAMMSLATGGWKLSALAGTKLTNRLRNGFSKVSDTGETISRRMAAEAAAKVAMKESGLNSARFGKAQSKLRREIAFDTVGESLVQQAVFEGLMSQNTLMQDSTLTDNLIGFGLMGGGTYLFRTIKESSTAIAALSGEFSSSLNASAKSQIASVPLGARGNLQEVVFNQRKIKMAEEYLADESKVIPSAQKQQLNQIVREQQARNEDLFNQITDSSLKVTQGLENHAAKVRRVVQGLSKSESNALAGATKIKPFDSNKFIPGLGGDGESLWAQHRVMSRLSPEGLLNLQGTIERAQQAGVYDAKALAKATGQPIVTIERTHELMNSAVLDVRTGQLFSADEAVHIAGAGDVKGLVYQAGIKLQDTSVSAAQVEFNHAHQSIVASRAPNNSLLITPEMLKRGLNLEARVYAKAYISTGKDLKAGSVTPAAIEAYDTTARLADVTHLAGLGMNPLEIASRTNSEWKVVDELVAKNFDSSTITSPLTKNISPSDWAASLEAENLAIIKGDRVVGTDRISLAAGLDDDAIRQANAEWTRTKVMESGSTMLNKLQDIQDTGLMQDIYAGLSGVNPARFSAKARLTTSAEQTLRNQPVVAEMIHVGSRLSTLSRDAVREIIKEDGLALNIIKTDPVKRVKFNQVESMLRSAKPADSQIVVWSEKEQQFGLRQVDDLEPTMPTFQALEDAHGNPVLNIPKAVSNFFVKYSETTGKENLKLQQFNRELKGQGKTVDKGIVLPKVNDANEFQAYIPGTEQGTMFLHSPTKMGLEELIAEAHKNPAYKGKSIITQESDINAFNILVNHRVLETDRMLDFSKGKTSSVHGTVTAGTSQIELFQQASQQQLVKLTGMAMKSMNPELMDFLGKMHRVSSTEEKTTLFKTLEKTIFGNSELNNFHRFNNTNESVVTALNQGLNKLDTMTSGIANSHNPEREVAEVMKAFKEAGIADELPWANVNKAVAETVAYKALGQGAEKVVANLNFVTATAALRFLDAAHAIVTTLSIPITTAPEVMMAMRGKGKGRFAPMKLMMEGVRRSYHPSMEKDIARWEELGIINADVSAANAAMREMVGNPSAIQRLDDNRAFQLMTKPSDWAEKNSRRVAASTASAMYDELHGAGAFRSASGEAYIDLFVKRAMGNYNSTQRPVMFQGTMGNALGLFQTYVWTMGQNIYRGLETGNKGAIATMMGIQGGLFGLRSLPGYDVANHYIGTHYGNTNNVDATSSIYDTFAGVNGKSITGEDTKAAETLLYGIPATLFNTSLWTRGVLNPRSPVGFQNGGLGVSFAGASPIIEAFNAVDKSYENLTNGMGVVDTIEQAFQLQQLSRPLSRYTDFLTGKSINRQGSVVDPDVDFKLSLAFFARATGARSLQEQVLRDGNYQTNYYSKQNGWNKKAVLRTMKSAVASQDTEGIIQAGHRYLTYGGSPNGLDSAMNLLYANNSMGLSAYMKSSELTRAADLLP